jgi:hypothetical protein
MAGAPLHWVPLAISDRLVTLLGKFTEPVVVALVVSSRALPEEAVLSVTTEPPAGRTICSDSRVATRGAVAKDL